MSLSCVEGGEQVCNDGESEVVDVNPAIANLLFLGVDGGIHTGADVDRSGVCAV